MKNTPPRDAAGGGAAGKQEPRRSAARRGGAGPAGVFRGRGPCSEPYAGRLAGVPVGRLQRYAAKQGRADGRGAAGPRPAGVRGNGEGEDTTRYIWHHAK